MAAVEAGERAGCWLDTPLEDSYDFGRWTTAGINE